MPYLPVKQATIFICVECETLKVRKNGSFVYIEAELFLKKITNALAKGEAEEIVIRRFNCDPSLCGDTCIRPPASQP